MTVAHHQIIENQPRSQGRARLGYADGRLSELYQQGCMKVLLPRFGREAVLINTSGGLTGGDRLSFALHLGAGEAATLTTQAAERIYRAASGTAKLDHRLHLDSGASLSWLPQETILFNGSAMERRLQVDLSGDARFLGLETFVFGRAANGETISHLHLRDTWHIRRNGTLQHVEALRINDMPGGAATFKDIRATATLLLAAPGAEDQLSPMRALLSRAETEGPVRAGATRTLPDLLVARFLAPDSQSLRRALVPLLTHLRQGPVPRVWQY